ncbi:hypothetical protein Tco_0458853 [Tanacetum coccineum]
MSHLAAFINVPIFVGNFFVMTDFVVLKNIDAYRDEGMSDVLVRSHFVEKYVLKKEDTTIAEGQKDTANNGQKIETKAMVFYQMETEEVSDRFVAPCFVNGLEAYDGEINLGVEENMISNEYAVKSFLRMTKAITNFGVGTITIYPDIDPFSEETEEEGKSNDDWSHFLKFNIDDILLLGEEGLPPFVCKMGKSSRNKKQAMENLNFFYQNIGTSSSDRVHTLFMDGTPMEINMLIQKKYLLIKELLEKMLNLQLEAEEESTMAFELIKFIKSMLEKLWEQTMMRSDHQDPNALDNMKPWKRMGCDGDIDDILRIRLREAGSDEEIFTLVAWIRAFNINELIYAELCHEFYSTYEFDEFARRLGLYQAVKLEKEGFNVYFEGGLRSDEHFNAQDYSTTGYDKVHKNGLCILSMFDARHQNGYVNVAWVIARWMKRKGTGTQKESQIFYGQFISKLSRKCKVLTEDVVRSLSALIYCRDLDTTTLRDLIDSDGKLIPKDPQPGVPRVGIPRPPKASMHDLYDRMGRMEICQEAIERMQYRQSYH